MKKLFLIIILTASMVYGGDDARKGTSGAEQLLIPVGAQGIATGSALVANLTGLESIYYNPAGLGVSENTEAMFSYMSYLADINVSYFAVSTVVGDVGSFGLSIKTFDFGDIPITTADFPDGTGNTYSPSYLTAGLTYSKILTDRISVGTNLKLISEKIMNTSASGFALDVGVQYRFNQQFSIGAVLKNVGSNMTYSGADLEQRTIIPNTTIGSSTGVSEILAEEFQIPSYFEIGVGYKYAFNDYNDILLASTFRANNSLEDNMSFGLEYSYLSTLFLRGGYRMQTENTSESIFGFTAGAGVNYDFANSIGIVVDYAFRDVQEFVNPNHIVTVKLLF
jgi:opacity protein-like surface antigen